ncbi:MAG: hypothetical protein M1833_005712 [Piccolia ochrophora]|nr:MAG: hypothetical protein M1833_005712 [Piccolia ochrophora]
MSSPENKSYLPVGLAGFSPWGSRSATPKPAASGRAGGEGPLEKQKGEDHAVSWKNRLNPKRYPEDCPSLNVRWFYAVDAPKRKPHLTAPSTDGKAVPTPKKYVSFGARDSRAVELAFQKLADEEDAKNHKDGQTKSGLSRHPSSGGQEATTETSSTGPDPTNDRRAKVPVNEDYLFDVDIAKRELGPAYWLGPIYEVRRGTWFYQEGTTLRPCDENLATQLEEGFLKVKPFRFPMQQRSSSKPRSRPTSLQAGEEVKLRSSSTDGRAQSPGHKADEGLTQEAPEPRIEAESSAPPQAQVQTHRLFGTYMNSVVTYQDSETAWILTDDFMSRMSSTVYQRFAGGGHLGGVKIVRGFRELGKGKESKPDDGKKAEGEKSSDTDRAPGVEKERNMENPLNRERKGSKSGDRESPIEVPDTAETPDQSQQTPESQARRKTLSRKVTNLVGSAEAEDPEKQEEEVRLREEHEIQDDYRDQDGEQDREIEHLILVTHGIGQRLGLRMESVNFVHDVNILRKTLKDVYVASADLQALNAEVEKLPKNCRVQVLPVCWRHLLDFPKQSRRQNRKENDVTDADVFEDDEEYPSLNDITVEGVPAIRNIITDLALDILLYQSAYREHISGIVLRECNHIYKLFKERNPNFKGHVSLMGHSLGSAILFDILCRQQSDEFPTKQSRRPDHSRSTSYSRPFKNRDLDLDFKVDSFFCVGSPIGLFQMLKGRTIAARQMPNAIPSESPLDPDSMDDPFLHAPVPTSKASQAEDKSETNSILPITVSSPKCAQLFNIFHPTDPIAYRIEPLISPAMSSLKPQPLPYTKKGIFGAPGAQGLSGIGAKVGQSVSGMWSSFSSNIASSILNRSLGITGDDVLASGTSNNPQAGASADQRALRMSVGAGTNTAGGGVIPTVPLPADAEGASEDRKRKLAGDSIQSGTAGKHPATLIESDLETLYAGFQKRRKSHQSDDSRDFGESAEWQTADDRGKKLRSEEKKVRELNSNGRVDFSIQEGTFDISLIASIASHLSYWADEDVSHFMISQLISRHRVVQEEGRALK